MEDNGGDHASKMSSNAVSILVQPPMGRIPFSSPSCPTHSQSEPSLLIHSPTPALVRSLLSAGTDLAPAASLLLSSHPCEPHILKELSRLG